MKRNYEQTQEYGQLGIIESVCLRNFMCHDNLTFDFDPHMNFIIGRNGSGKSAVLTGIILALGGKSGSTGRHTNIKGFIKTGKHSATVSVTLKNCGPEAYKSKEYGSKITVERHFNSEGVSTYKIKSQSGQILSTSKEELTNILNIMDIQIENPITVLTQEISRNFLVSKNSKGHKLFQLFYSGTGLLRIEEDYKRAVQQKEETEVEIVNKKAALPEMEKEVKLIKNRLDKASKITELKKELLWAMVIQFEKERDKEREIVESLQKKSSAINKNIDAFKKEHNNVTQALTQARADTNDSNQKMDKLRKELHEQNKKRSDLTSSIREIRGTSSRYERELNELSKEGSNLENMINEIKLKNQNDVNEEKMKREARIDELKLQAQTLDMEIKALDKRKASHFQTLRDANSKVDGCHEEIQELKYKLKSIEKEKQQLMDGMANRINVFGSEMKNLLQDIRNAANAGVFKIEPKGPIGLYINVKNPEWNFAVQECLKSGFLKNFCCDNHSDANELTKIIYKHYSSSRMRPSIITTKFVNKVFDVEKFKTKTPYPTVLDMLEIKDAVVANCLIDQRQIENILLIADQTEAICFMMENPPRNCVSVYTLSGDQICQSPYRFYSCRNTNQICMLKHVNKDDIRKKEGELNEINSALGKKHAIKDNLGQEVKHIQTELKKIDTYSAERKIKLKNVQMKVADEENSQEEPKDMDGLQNHLEQLQKDKKKVEEQLSSCRQAINLKNEELLKIEEAIEKIKNALEVETRNIHTLSGKIDEYESKREKLNSSIKKFENHLRTVEPSLAEGESKLADATAATQMAKRNAEAVSPPIATRKSADTIRQMIKEMEKVQEQKNCDRETLLNKYQEKVEKLNQAKSELERQEYVSVCIDKMMIERFQEFQKICKNTVVSLTCCFTTLLKQNHFSGYPEVNLEAKTLEIFAKPEKMNSSVGGKQNLNQLSGGERSYITLAFLLALWDRIHMPFRILDEYDVFMDQNNRHLSINLLINEARSNKHIQYIFLSPLDLPPMARSSHVKVHKMPAPKR